MEREPEPIEQTNYKVNEVLGSFKHTIFVVEPIEYRSVDAYPERRLLLAIIDRAIEDLEYLYTAKSKEDRNYGRSALIWLFFEDIETIDSFYLECTDKDIRKINITCFENICSWLDIDPNLIRSNLCAKYNLPVFLIKK